MRLADVIRVGAGARHGDFGARWRRRNRGHFARSLADQALFDERRLPAIGYLRGRVLRADGSVDDLGLMSCRVVTAAGMAFVVDAFQGLTELDAMRFHGLGLGATPETVSDTRLYSELTSQYETPFTRVAGTRDHPADGVYRSVAVIAVAEPAVITEHGLFSTASRGTGVMLDRSVFAPVALAAGDAFEMTYDFAWVAGAVVAPEPEPEPEFADPVANPSGSPTSGETGSTITLIGAATTDPARSVAAWEWSRTNGTVLYTTQNPLHVLQSTAGTETVRLRVRDTGNVWSAYVTHSINVSVGAPPEPISLAPVADASVDSGASNTNYGTSTEMEVDGSGSSPIAIAYLKFNLTAHGGKTVDVATLTLHCTNAASGSVSVSPVTDDSWAETGITWNNRPSYSSAVATFTPTSVGQDYTITLPDSLVQGALGGYLSLALWQTGTNGAYFSTREGSVAPTLDVAFSA